MHLLCDILNTILALLLGLLLLDLRVLRILGLRCNSSGSWPILITLVPPLNNEYVTVFLELGEKIRTLLVLDGDLACKLTFQRLGLHCQLSLLIFSGLVGVLDEFIDRCHVRHQQLLTRLAHVSVETRVGLVLTLIGRTAELIVNLLNATLFDLVDLCQLLKGDSLGEEFVEVKVIVSQEFQTTRLYSLV